MHLSIKRLPEGNIKASGDWKTNSEIQIELYGVTCIVGENINLFECTGSENTYKINGRNINSGPNSCCITEIDNLDLLSVITPSWFYIGWG